MNCVKVGIPKHSVEDGKLVVSVRIDLGSRSVELYYRVSDGPVAEGGEAFLAAALLPAMKLGSRLDIASPVSPRLLESSAQICDIFSCWQQSLHPVTVVAEPEQAISAVSPPEVACFFRGVWIHSIPS